MRKITLAGAFLFLTISSSVRADEKQTCAEAYSQGQALRDSHKLISAHTQFLTCSRDACAPFMKGVMVKECAQWLSDTERRMPSVVFTAKRGGVEMLDVKVTVDREMVWMKLDGQAIQLDPGQHSATFEAADGNKVDVRFTAEEGIKDKSVSAKFPAPAGAPATTGAPPASTTSTFDSRDQSVPAPEVAPTTAENAPAWSSTARILGYAGIAAGAVGLAVGTVFGIKAIVNKNDANCVNKSCDAGPLGDARSAATLSNLGFGVGGTLFAGGVIAMLLAPRELDTKAENLSAAALMSPNAGGLLLRARW